MPISWACNKVVSHGSTGAEVISFGTGPWLEGPPPTPTGVWFRADFVLASFPYPSGWPVMAERAVRSAARRRERRLRSMWRHEQLSVRMAVATASHHSWKVPCCGWYSD